MTEPKIFTKNYVNADDVFTVSSGAASIANAYDRDTISQWISSGANSDSTNVTLTIAFYEGTVAASRVIDSLLLINHNLKAFDLNYWNGSAWVLWQAFTGLASSTLFQSLSIQTTSQIQLVMYTTQVANQEKAIGELVACALQLDIGVDVSSYTVNFRQNRKTLILGDGSMREGIVFWSKNRSQKYEAAVGFQYLTMATLASLAAIKEAALPFLWYPESVTRPDTIYLVSWTNPLTWKYESLYKGAGLDVTMELKEL